MLHLQLVLGFFLRLVSCQDNDFWVPVSPEQVLTIDMQDKIRFELLSLFNSPSKADLQNVSAFLMSWGKVDWEPSNSIEILQPNEIIFTNSTKYSSPMIELFYKENTAYENLGKYRDFCMFAVKYAKTPDFLAN